MLEKYRNRYKLTRKVSDQKYTKTKKYELARKAFRSKEEEKIKIKARMDLNNAVRDGKVTRLECCVCGNHIVQAHHVDYDKPFEVVWLCSVHHKELHKGEK